jgi:hypothetical protein
MHGPAHIPWITQHAPLLRPGSDAALNFSVRGAAQWIGGSATVSVLPWQHPTRCQVCAAQTDRMMSVPPPPWQARAVSQQGM